MLSMFSVLALTLFVLAARIHIVQTARLLEIRATGKRALDAIAACDPDWDRHWDAFDDGPSLERMLLQLHKWTHAQFYPGSEA